MKKRTKVAEFLDFRDWFMQKIKLAVYVIEARCELSSIVVTIASILLTFDLVTKCSKLGLMFIVALIEFD